MKVASLAVWSKPSVYLNSAGFANHRAKELDGPYGPSRHQRVMMWKQISGLSVSKKQILHNIKDQTNL